MVTGDNELASQINLIFLTVFAKVVVGEPLPNSKLEMKQRRKLLIWPADTLPLNYDSARPNVSASAGVGRSSLLTDAQDDQENQVCDQLPQNAFQVFLSVSAAVLQEPRSPETFTTEWEKMMLLYLRMLMNSKREKKKKTTKQGV